MRPPSMGAFWAKSALELLATPKAEEEIVEVDRRE